MYAYSMAAAHENLPHLQLEQYMVSNVDSWGEGWPWVDAIENNCEPPVDGIFFPGRPLPTLLHYCQSYRVQHPTGMFGFGKRGAPENMFTCESPMFKEPPNDLDKSPVQRRKMVSLVVIGIVTDADDIHIYILNSTIRGTYMHKLTYLLTANYFCC